MANEDAINYWISVGVQKNSGLKKMRGYFIVCYKGTEGSWDTGEIIASEMIPKSFWYTL